MSSLENIIDFSRFREFIFGKNNIRLDVLLDKFYSIRQEKRSKLVFFSVLGLILFFISSIIFYFYGLHILQVQLNEVTRSFNQLSSVKGAYLSINQEFKKLSNELKNTNSAGFLHDVIDAKAKELNIDLTFVSEKATVLDLSAADPMSSHFQKVRMDCKLNSVSLRKIIDFLSLIQKTENKLKVEKLEIQQKFGTKLYFDVNVSIAAYSAKR
jgi:hypothetical protein